MTQKQLAYAIGRSYFTVVDYERGPKRTKPYTPSVPVLLRIARVLDCRVEDFFADSPDLVGDVADEREQAPAAPGSPGSDERGSAAHSRGVGVQ